MSAASSAALRAFEARFAKDFGPDKIVKPHSRKRIVVPTGSLLLDYATGIGGLVNGRCYESWGPPTVGKTTMGLIMIAEHQRRFPDRRVALLDVEHTFEEAWAEAHGVDLNRLWVVEPKTAEEVADEVRRFIDSGFCSMVAVDSIGAMIGQVEIEKLAAEMTVGTIAKIVTRMIRMAAPSAVAHACTFHVINQIRANVGKYGPDLIPSGGNSLQHGTTAQFYFKKSGEDAVAIGSLKNREIVGHVTNVVVSKNKVAPPMRSAMITLLNQPTAEYGPTGIDQAAEAFQLADRLDLFKERSGGWYTLTDDSRHHGQEAVREHFRAHPTIISDIRQRSLARVAHTVVQDELKEGTAS